MNELIDAREVGGKLQILLGKDTILELDSAFAKIKKMKCKEGYDVTGEGCPIPCLACDSAMINKVEK